MKFSPYVYTLHKIFYTLIVQYTNKLIYSVTNDNSKCFVSH